MDYWLTQALTNHDYFGAYLCKYGKLGTAECWFCGSDTDDTFHTSFQYDAWESRRSNDEIEIGGTFTLENMMDYMLKNASGWKCINGFIHEVLKKKSEEERRRHNHPA